MVVKTHKRSMRSKRNSSSKKNKRQSGKKTMKNRKVIRGGLRTYALSKARGKEVLANMQTMEEIDEMYIEKYNKIMENNLLTNKQKLEQIANLVKNYSKNYSNTTNAMMY